MEHLCAAGEEVVLSHWGSVWFTLDTRVPQNMGKKINLIVLNVVGNQYSYKDK